MLLLLFASLLSMVVTQKIPCTEYYEDENVLECQFNNTNVTFKYKKNEYANIYCQTIDFAIPANFTLNIANDMNLDSLGITSCHTNILRSVNRLTSATSFTTIVLKGVIGPLLGEDVKNLGDVENLFFRDMGTLTGTHVPTEAINALPSLKSLRMTDGFFQLAPNAFNGAISLEYLELSGHIQNIPAMAFAGLTNLTNLNIWGNDFEYIVPGAFIGLENLTSLTLSTNLNLASLEAGVFDGVPKLRNIKIMNNGLTILPNGVFGGLKDLESITILMNQDFLSFGTHALSNVTSLQHVKILSAGLQSLPEELFKDSSNIQTISINGESITELPKKIFRSQVNLKRLDLSNNQIEGIDSDLFSSLKEIEYINLAGNYITHLPRDLFSGQGNLKEVIFDNNKIVSIDFNAFQGVPIEQLSLVSNELTFDYDDETMSPFENLPQLINLNLKDNKICNFFDDWRFILRKLETLDLSNNNLTQAPAPMSFLHNATIDLRSNHISKVWLPTYTPPPANRWRYKPQFLLDDNPLTCDCEIYGLWQRLNGKIVDDEPEYVINETKCSFPEHLQEFYVKNIPSKLLVCDIPCNVSSECDSCVAISSSNEIALECNQMPKVLPNPDSENYTFYFTKQPTLTVKLNEQPDTLQGYNVHTLNLSNCQLESIDFSPTESLKVLDLSNNFITNVPIEFLEGDISLYLGNNPITCDCWHVNDIIMLKRYQNLMDYDKIVCSNDVYLNELDVTVLCNSLYAAITGALVFMSMLLIMTVLFLLLYKYWYEVKVILHDRFGDKIVTRSDMKKKYHLFISFAHQNYIYIKLLVDRLETEFKQKICLHFRDWEPGESIPQQIINTVNNSCKTVIFLTNEFLDSDWANLEFRTAYELTLKDHRNRVIIILLDEDLVHDPRLSKELRAYLTTHTYLVWDEPNFWRKLSKVLPRTEYSITFLIALRKLGCCFFPFMASVTNDVEEVRVQSSLNVHLNENNELVNEPRNCADV
ncbi:uncharacterized protein LOC142985543 [Anticarsia gemmatalis]|uniref:uncharacterized protein LOC142985543 n=1 Tax=Anticarsia gemmatalis TaxID=129554 RepID=UPI003F76C403